MLFNIGVDRCKTLTELTREKDNEVTGGFYERRTLKHYFQVLICDNMALPYKDDSFDAVLSIAVIHHIATTERRVRALRELARILRVGGRIIIRYVLTSHWSIETILSSHWFSACGAWSRGIGGSSLRTC